MRRATVRPAMVSALIWCGLTRRVRSIALPLLILAAIALIPTEAGAGSITYDVVNYPAVQNGITVSGTITTDGSTGVETSPNFITGFDVTLSSPGSAPFTLQPSDAVLLIDGSLEVTPSSITLGPALSVLSILTSGGGNPGAGLYYSTSFYKAPEGVIGLLGGLTGGPGGSVSGGLAWDSPPVTTIATAAVTASAVPEPSSLLLSGIGVVCGLAYVLVRKRRAQHRRGAGGPSQPTE
jgi:hypothetical protein